MYVDQALQGSRFVERLEVLVLDGRGERGLQKGVGVSDEGVVDVDRDVIKACEPIAGEATVAVDDDVVRRPEVCGALGMGCMKGLPVTTVRGWMMPLPVRHLLYGREAGPRVVRVRSQLLYGNARGFVGGLTGACRQRGGLAREGREAGGAAAHGLGYCVEVGGSAESVGFAHVRLQAISRMGWAWWESGA
ncbi:hypothetical protein [Streptomyces parvulus]|uniref:hypothetical protein n=1 Tax=Streptomyces parvulus TaxID=146923 RepID=UPI00340E45A6